MANLDRIVGFYRPDNWVLEQIDGPLGYSDCVDFEEVTIEELDMKRARSFRADLIHKLNIIHRAYGTIDKAAHAIGVNEVTFDRWLGGRRTPYFRHQCAIDDTYQLAIEMLIQAKREKVKKATETKARRSARKAQQAQENASE